MIVAAILYKERNSRIIAAALLIFLLFMVPVLLLPPAVCDQTYEYRMYLPMFGIFLLLPQTVILQNKLTDKQLLMCGISVACLFAILNFRHQKNFENPLAFWTQAAATSPHSSQACMRLAARIGDPEKSDALFLKAFSINPREKSLNFIYGVRLQGKDSILASEKYFLTEKSISACDECDLYLARVAIEKKDLKGAISLLQTFLNTDKTNKIANDNLLLLYLDTDQDDQAKAQAKHMLELGLDVPPTVRAHFNL
jgi:tetratricopeptide (TPR) repeat protein